MSVHLVKGKYWACSWIDKADKKQKWKHFGHGLQAEADAREFDKTLNHRPWQRKTPAAGSARFIELVNLYIKAKLAVNQTSTIDNFGLKMKKIILPQIGQTQAIRLTERRLDQYVVNRLKAGVKRTTVHRELSDIQAVLNWSVRRKYLTYNPIATYEKPKRDDAVIQPPTLDEIHSLLAAAPDHLFRAIVISFYTGIRPGQRELLSRCWHDVDWQAKTLFVVSAKKGGDIKSRKIPLAAELMQELHRWHAADCSAKLMPERIIHYRGKPILRISKAFAAAKVRAKITRRLRPYDFRHAFATALLKNRSDLKSTSELLGHSRPDTTTRIYQHTDTDMHRQVINNLPNIILPKYKTLVKNFSDK